VKNTKRIMVFGSHRPHPGESEYEEALALGRAIAVAGYDVASGGYGGIMEAVLQGAAEMGREGYGYTSDVFPAKPNRFVSREIRTSTLLNRIEAVIHGCAGFVVLKGGTGTLLELAACWEMVNKKMIESKPIICMGTFWRPVVETLSGEPSIKGLDNLEPVADRSTEVISFAADNDEVVEILAGTMG